MMESREGGGGLQPRLGPGQHGGLARPAGAHDGLRHGPEGSVGSSTFRIFDGRGILGAGDRPVGGKIVETHDLNFD